MSRVQLALTVLEDSETFRQTAAHDDTVACSGDTETEADPATEAVCCA